MVCCHAKTGENYKTTHRIEKALALTILKKTTKRVPTNRKPSSK